MTRWMVTEPMVLPALNLHWLGFPIPEWWHNVENDPKFQLYANYGLAGAYGLIAAVALVQLARIQLRVPEYGWTTQKVFHLLNCLVCLLRGGVLVFRPQLDNINPTALKVALLDLPGLLFFTTYTLLVLFWAEIYHQARSMPTGSLRPVFIGINLAVYCVQAGFWALSTMASTEELQQLGYVLSDIFLAAVSVSAAVGFLLYGSRLFLMLQRFPIESRGRRKKLHEVGLVTSICAGCFSIRAIIVALCAFDRENLELDVLSHPLLNVLYYTLVEIVPSACVLYILRKLPPKRTNQQGYQQIPSS
uniref:THH1/TOM1/TOM3 domain-containing protein n=1 Tax=Chlamydomonas chlamydogama TaxID=225041 RepID=A0A7S2QVE3_9CHLO|mmetsp:Transcript_564/g.1253  ORF Transcript_564/g.1253 Transcript_564/m.1253 type:complete len:304 (+) Transcript_564:225-1136(+)|eukprot:CAMPEP_0202900080 /NCGR_PEP_ID=MMETSP1392-20130828/9690_1 /ASSEMBLY_ACC=CAM_ASM_000868 /TAXON_ID=225041 /ORGANISM="Chlamydomonas chlamydogama, Strain SAG 11-48b" /LENGTH=303 /DNA_ID=CAMNT_0049586397 /DNA_START=222 /DNA_END=1133 /DNA_ORIENTATION=-